MYSTFSCRCPRQLATDQYVPIITEKRSDMIRVVDAPPAQTLQQPGLSKVLGTQRELRASSIDQVHPLIASDASAPESARHRQDKVNIGSPHKEELGDSGIHPEPHSDTAARSKTVIVNRDITERKRAETCCYSSFHEWLTTCRTGPCL